MLQLQPGFASAFLVLAVLKDVESFVVNSGCLKAFSTRCGVGLKSSKHAIYN